MATGRIMRRTNVNKFDFCFYFVWPSPLWSLMQPQAPLLYVFHYYGLGKFTCKILLHNPRIYLHGPKYESLNREDYYPCACHHWDCGICSLQVQNPGTVIRLHLGCWYVPVENWMRCINTKWYYNLLMLEKSIVKLCKLQEWMCTCECLLKPLYLFPDHINFYS